MKGQEFYQADAVAEAYEDKRFSRGGRLIDRREKEAVLEALSPLQDRRILEIACGTGRFTVMLAERDADIVGLDISQAMLSQGREKAKRAGVTDRLDFMRGDAARLPFPDNHFDAVFAMRFFHLADTPQAFLTEMARVSKDLVFFDTFNARSARSVYNWALPMGSRLYEDSEVTELIAGADLELEAVTDDFVLPYGLYRKIPDWMADGLRDLDTAATDGSVGESLATVSYWTARHS
ncbi:class I SAM-dependent methyltransferase [Halodesulfurarchaeum sp. HSR-GB]|uniref:S-adenosylmethionine-dependent methyltransferase n=1 Tax=Halodesulfurarchaeum formicicum TaxID=1873524 RepID=A0A1J1ADI9_9EURY|nr:MULTISPECIES: class I SAM-dependent methyltransferase [Halodesulfurarchaeum]APE95965.1 S-adenosylmethionine-dependent methyltransferase [Halodesulfurarchaeum formicicum]MDR5656774.1 class I SAM-dependent methyltransferase [Halodesulfurarchaeum sp. HSR-GB]